jgi:hypothetical protein
MRSTARTLTSKTHLPTQAQVSEGGRELGTWDAGVPQRVREDVGVRDSGCGLCSWLAEGVAGQLCTGAACGVLGKSPPRPTRRRLQAAIRAVRSLKCYGRPVGVEPNLQNQLASLQPGIG